ncbi:MAG: bacterioferritin [Kangiellaceae bacterium]|jgi:bacterioferritin|nr:bacterioferritin [Kangiellaceae bacterium]
MRGNPEVINSLNKILTLELTSINQFFLHARMLGNWGFEKLNKAEYKKSILDMKQADRIIERVLMLEGLPNLQKLEKLHIGETAEEMFNCDLTFINAQLTELRTAIKLCEDNKDFVSRDLLVNILNEEEDYVDWLETQQHLIASTSLANYLQSQI